MTVCMMYTFIFRILIYSYCIVLGTFHVVYAKITYYSKINNFILRADTCNLTSQQKYAD